MTTPHAKPDGTLVGCNWNEKQIRTKEIDNVKQDQRSDTDDNHPHRSSRDELRLLVVSDGHEWKAVDQCPSPSSIEHRERIMEPFRVRYASFFEQFCRHDSTSLLDVMSCEDMTGWKPVVLNRRNTEALIPCFVKKLVHALTRQTSLASGLSDVAFMLCQ